MAQGEEESSETWSSLTALAKGVSRLLNPSSPSPGEEQELEVRGFNVAGVVVALLSGGKQKRKEKMLRRRVLAQPFCKQPQNARLITQSAVTGVCSPPCPSDKGPDTGKGACFAGTR